MKKIFKLEELQLGNLIFFFIIYLITTNSYFNYEQSLIFGGADGFSYFEISQSAPKFANIPLQPIHAERFFFPFLIGLLNKLFSIEIYSLYQIFVFVVIVLINCLLIRILRNAGVNSFNLLISITLLNLNPYLTRYYIANPLILNDLIFILGTLNSILGISLKNKKMLFIGLIISSLARQSAIAIPISLFVIFFLTKKKFFLNSKDIIFLFVIFIFTYFLGYFYSGSIPQTEERYDQYFITIFGIFIENVSFQKITLFLIWPFLSFAPLIMFLIFYFKINKKKLETFYDLSLFLIFFSTLIIAQPLLQGYEVSGKNIIRLSSMAFLPIMILFQINSKPIFLKIDFKIIFYFIIIFIWNCHPTFSIFDFLENYRF